MDMMTTLNNSYHLLYKQALIDPSKLSEDELLGLLLKYPYSQPLVFAYERRKKLINQESLNKELALLYAHSESWLMNYVNKPVSGNAGNDQSVSPLIGEESVDEVLEFPTDEMDSEIGVDVVENNTDEWDEDVVSIDEIEEQAPDLGEENLEISREIADNLSPNDVVSDDANDEQEDDKALEKLLHEGSITGDYFIFDSHEKIESSSEEKKVEINTPQPAVEEKEDISLYNDDLMPYSFRWWLHKTRLEHAETYQPYISSQNPLVYSKPQIDFGVVEDSILDQQIKENIIHFQDPEEKLSEEVKRKPIVPVPPKKGSEIIEKFIQKDPIIHPPSPENINNENMARQSAEDNYIFVTETLANIYIDQGLFIKAKEVFNKLILKYPEKKSYFATRIQELEKNL